VNILRAKLIKQSLEERKWLWCI